MKKLIAQTVAVALSSVPVAAFASEAELARRVEQLAAELEKVKAELAATKKQIQATAAAAPAVVPVAAMPAATAPIPMANAPAPVAAAPAAAPATSNTPGAYASNSQASTGEPQTVVTGYGEVNYNHPVRNASQTQVDVRRAVIGLQHRFDDKTKFVGEFEWEHAVTSATDQGESEVEQLFVEREFSNGLRGKAGLFLMPVGLLNTNHEPTAYYGVERNFVETAIIPSTWREAGLGLSGNMSNGLDWDTGVTTGFDMSKWDATSTEGRDSPLGSIHQEGQLAKGRDLSVHAALNWRGVPGLLLGGSVFTGGAGHANTTTPGFVAQDARVTLWDLHGRYTPGRWDLSALYARGTITGVDAQNLIFAGSATPIPSSFYGWYAQAAYRLFTSGDYTLSPFVRYESFNTAVAYAGLPSGLGAATGPNEKVSTVGANLYVGEGVVLKADYQKFNVDRTRDRVNLGVGFSF